MEFLSKYPSDGIKHLIHVEVYVEDVKSCFAPCFSTPGFELHERETEIVYNWHSFLRTVSRGKLKCNIIPFPQPSIPSTDDTDDLKHDNLELRFLTLSDVLQFGSGSRFPNFAGKLEFDHESVSTEKRISGNTSALSIAIPVNKRYTCNSNEFAQKLMEDIFEAHGFGLPQVHV